MTALIRQFIHSAHRNNTPVALDLDDYIFDPDVYRESAIFDLLDPLERVLHLRMAHAIQMTLKMVDVATVSTSELRDAITSTGKQAIMIPNAISPDMIQSFASSTSHSQNRQPHDAIIIGYLSGTSTHHRDVQSILPAIGHILHQHPTVRLLLAGPLSLNSSFENQFRHRIIRSELVNWEQLSTLYHPLDINLAPLELYNVFCNAKSPIKYLEAALAQTPTIASSTRAFREVIRHGETGYLATTTEDWINSLEQLIASESLRKQIGHAAFQDIQKNYLLENTRSIWTDMLSNGITG